MSMFEFSKIADAAVKLDAFMEYVRASIETVLTKLDGIESRIELLEDNHE